MQTMIIKKGKEKKKKKERGGGGWGEGWRPLNIFDLLKLVEKPEKPTIDYGGF